MLRIWPPALLCLMFLATTCGRPAATPQPASPITAPREAPVRDTYLTLGDSVAAGVGATPSRQGYGELLFEQLRPAEPALSRHVNLAVPGETSASPLGDQLQVARTELASRRVRLVTLAIGANDLLDLLPLCRDAMASAYCRAAGEAALRDVRANLQQAVDALQAADSGTCIVLLTYYNPLAGLLPGSHEYVARLNEIILEQALEEGLPGVDVAARFAGREDQLTHIVAGDVHPNGAGHRLIARAVAEAILHAGILVN